MASRSPTSHVSPRPKGVYYRGPNKKIMIIVIVIIIRIMIIIIVMIRLVRLGFWGI